MNINTILLENSNFFDNLGCKEENCLSYIIVFLNILAVLYLVFCSYVKHNKITKCFGIIYTIILLASTITIVAYDTCIFTLFCSIFTVLIAVAMISEIVDKTEKAKKEGVIKGSYIIGQDYESYYFSLYDKNKRLLASSPLRLLSYEDCIDAINETRENGSKALKEDRTLKLIQRRQQPKFILEKTNQKYKFILVSCKGKVILESLLFNKYSKCNKTLIKVQKVVMTSNIYVLSDVLFADTEEYNKDETIINEAYKVEEKISNVEEKNEIRIVKKGIIEKYNDLSSENKIVFDEILSYFELEKIFTKLETINYYTFTKKINKKLRLKIKISIRRGLIEVVINRYEKNNELDLKPKNNSSTFTIHNEEELTKLKQIMEKLYLV